jgi:hypothetical protein
MPKRLTAAKVGFIQMAKEASDSGNEGEKNLSVDSEDDNSYFPSLSPSPAEKPARSKLVVLFMKVKLEKLKFTISPGKDDGLFEYVIFEFASYCILTLYQERV